jgi:hypothetical protein
VISLTKEKAEEKASFEASLAESHRIHKESESTLDEKMKSCELQKLEIEKLKTEISINDRVAAGIKAIASENNPSNIQSYGNTYQKIHNLGGTVNQNGPPASNGNGGGNNWHPPSDGGGNNWRPPSGPYNDWHPPYGWNSH